MFLSVPSDASIPSHRISQADLLTTFIDEILSFFFSLSLSIYIFAPLASYCFFRNHIFWLKTHPFTKYQAEMLTLDETLSLTFGKTMPSQKDIFALFLLMSWMPLRVQHTKTKYRCLKCMKLCPPPKKSLKSGFQLQVFSLHVAMGMSQATGV